MNYKQKQVDPELMDQMIRQRITDMIAHAEYLVENGEEDLADFVLENSFEFAEQIDEQDGVLWLPRIK